MIPTAQTGVVFPPRDLTALLDLGTFLEHHTEPALLLGPDGEQVPLPEEVYRVVVEVVQAMRGRTAVLAPDRYVICASAPDDVDSTEAWTRCDIVAAGTGRPA